ncbi:MAG: 50S ribosomal protein L13 [candidate division NC10 bacterium]|nr:50S ribosomal protein L13 [candidate division NC10 bacterium]MCH7896356.1 50S ribosomal protein L13 [candidate division NC10 bacterium]MCZ6550797.1 50S ribosomal protein L13 [candidate division NC10 bacterium]
MPGRTYSAKKGEVERHWYVVDAQGKVLGRLASEVAMVLRGKRKPQFTPHVDTGDFVIVVNAEKVLLTGKKLQQKIYYRASGYPGGLKATVAGALLKSRPERLMQHAVRGMLPKNKLGDQLYRKLKVYAGGKHPHQAQKPVSLEFR